MSDEIELMQPHELQTAKEKIQRMRREVMRVFMGSSRTIELILVALIARGHVLLEGVPGVAKTTLAKAFCSALGCEMRRIQFTPDLLPADITGTYVLSPKEGTFSLRKGPVFANVVLADEINRAPAKTQSALLEAMQEHQVTIEGDRYELPAPFIVVATQNPIDLEGTYPLPEAQIDRFLLRIAVGYPTHRDEVSMLRAHSAQQPVAEAVLSAESVRELQQMASNVFVQDDIYEYAVALAGFTRVHALVLLGASPRATLALVQAAKALAVITGRNYVTPDDISELVGPVFAHRLVLSPESDGDDFVRQQVIQEALSKVGYRKTANAV